MILKSIYRIKTRNIHGSISLNYILDINGLNIVSYVNNGGELFENSSSINEIEGLTICCLSIMKVIKADVDAFRLGISFIASFNMAFSVDMF